MDIEVRPLEVDDVFQVVKMLGKITRSAREELVELLRPDTESELAEGVEAKKADPVMVGLIIFQCLFTELEEDLKEWMASLVNKSSAEFSKMPAIVVIDLIETLVRQEDVRGFFARASRLASMNLSI